MSDSTFPIPAHSFRKLPTPLESQGIFTYNCVVPASAIPVTFLNWMDVNAREPSLVGRVPKAIRSTLNECPEYFVAYNRGLAIMAEAVSYDNQTQTISLVFSDKSLHGVFDGGHTLSVILDQRTNNDEGNGKNGDEAFCKLEIMTGVPKELITNIVDARNTSKQVASKSLDNLSGRFQELKDTLGTKLTSLISWKENEDAPVDVREVVALLTTLDRCHYDDTNHPLVTYSGKEACLKHFENNPECYAKTYSLAKDVLNLWELIQSEVPKQYNAETGGRFGGLKGCKPLSKPRELSIIGSSTDYPFPNGYVYPIVAAFRSMVVEKDGIYAWGKGITPCKLVRDGLANKIFSGPIVTSIREVHNPNRTGKDANVWGLAYSIAENYYLRLK